MVDQFIGKPELIEANDKSPIFICTQCGECCHIREKKNITESEEASYRRYMYRHYGVIYLANLSDITINIWPEEKYMLEKRANDNGIKLSIKPKRAIYDKSKHRLIILDYYIDHDVCPFFDIDKRQCGIYDIRPHICRSYPLTGTESDGKCKYKKKDMNSYGNELLEARKLSEVIRRQKELINMMLANKEITLLESITEQELRRIIATANMVELVFDK
jgi:Fe-S-cluster containining protein